MKRNFKLASLALGALTAAAMTGCTAESGYINEPTQEGDVAIVKLVKDAEITAYSGGKALKKVGSRSVAYDGDLNNRDFWQSYGAQSLNNITDDERRGVLEAIDAKTNGTQISEDLVFPWTAYFLQDVISGQNGNFTNAGSNNGTSASYVMEVWDKGKYCDAGNEYNDYGKHHYFDGVWNNSTNSFGIYEDYEEEHSNYSQVTNSAHINSYYLKGTNPDEKERIEETTLLYDMTVGTYEEMKGRQFRWYINCHGNLHWSEYIIVQYEGSYYICFDFACGYPENQNIDGHNQKGCEVNDWDYNDWILKITPAGNQPDVWTDPEGEQKEEDCPKCHHPKHNPGECDDPDCDVEECIPGNDDPTQGDDVTTTKPANITEHVEVNLSIEDREEHQGYLSSHLSIHVRAVTDVEIFIPVPMQYYVQTDDMDIVQKHEKELMIHGGPSVTEWDLTEEGYGKITLTVVFEENGIRVSTEGINENLIAFLKEERNDGITFEVWNYFNIPDIVNSDGKEIGSLNNISKSELKECLDKSTIEFKNYKKLPNLYVNAFMYKPGCGEEEHECGKFEDDCIVDIVEGQKGNYKESETDNFYNGSPYNELYYNVNYDPSQEENSENE